MKTQSPPAGHERIPRWLFLLIPAVLVLGTVLTGWGTRGSRTFHTGPRAELLVSGTVPPAGLSSPPARGQQLHTMYCAGCHEYGDRLAGPSYQVIAASYRAVAKQRSGADVLSLLAAGISHPLPGWDDYPPGPSHPVLTTEERATLANWILQGAPGAAAPDKKVESP